jgi:anti-sigma-K factor RskA
MNDLHRDGEELRDDLAAYALGALERDEVIRLERHLEDCETCRDRLQWLRPAVDQLPAAVEQRTPPERLRKSLMATVRAEAAATAAPAARRSSWWDGLRAAMLRPATGMAVLIVLVVGVATGYLVRGEDGDSEFIPARSGSAVTASATLERHGDSGTLHVNELPPLDRDEVYEVWIQRGDVMEPASTFVLRGDGSAEAAVPGPLDDAEAVLVTAEPRPGTSQPTGEPVLEASLQ